LWLAQENYLFIFNDQDLEWVMQNDSLPAGTIVSNFIEDAGSLGCYTNNGYFLFNELNSVWQDQSQGLESRQISDACKVDSTIYLATESGPFSKSGNDDWTPQYNDLFGLAVDDAFVYNGKIYALANDKIYLTIDIENGFEALETHGYCPANDLVVTDDGWYEGSSCGFSISVDSGQTWTDFSNGLEGLGVRRIAKTNVYYYAATSRNQGLYRSHTYHNAWERVPNDLGTMIVGDLAVLDNKIYAVTSNGLYRSGDFGTTFSLLSDAGNGSSLLVKNNVIFFQRPYDILYSTDLGNSWQTWIDNIEVAYPLCLDVSNSLGTTVIGGFIGPWNPYGFLEIFDNDNPYGKDIIDDLPSYMWSSIIDVLIDNEKIFACPSSGGLWYRDDLMVGVNEEQNSNPAPLPLSLYPNPVKDILTIQLKDNTQINEYQVIDYSGRMVMKGMISNENGDGTINVSSLAPGLYLILEKEGNGDVLCGRFLRIN
jgi:hypothetical protein